jgi:hypothetical protein
MPSVVTAIRAMPIDAMTRRTDNPSDAAHNAAGDCTNRAADNPAHRTSGAMADRGSLVRSADDPLRLNGRGCGETGNNSAQKQNLGFHG